MVARPKADLILFENEKHRLEAYTQLRKTTKALALRSRIILECSVVLPMSWWLRN